MSKWIKFEEIEAKGKTKIFRVASKENGAFLGTVKWHGPWRKYSFFPNEETIFESDCLTDIAEFLNKLMGDRKKVQESKIKNFGDFLR